MLDSERTYPNFFVFWLFFQIFSSSSSSSSIQWVHLPPKGIWQTVTESFLQQSQNSSEGTCAIALPAQQSKADIKLCSLFLQGRYSQVNGGGGGGAGGYTVFVLRRGQDLDQTGDESQCLLILLAWQSPLLVSIISWASFLTNLIRGLQFCLQDRCFICLNNKAQDLFLSWAAADLAAYKLP